MDILLTTINYPPEVGGAAHLYHQLALSLKNRGHEVTAPTNYPCYNVQDVPPNVIVVGNLARITRGQAVCAS